MGCVDRHVGRVLRSLASQQNQVNTTTTQKDQHRPAHLGGLCQLCLRGALPLKAKGAKQRARTLELTVHWFDIFECEIGEPGNHRETRLWRPALCLRRVHGVRHTHASKAHKRRTCRPDFRQGARVPTRGTSCGRISERSRLVASCREPAAAVFHGGRHTPGRMSYGGRHTHSKARGHACTPLREAYLGPFTPYWPCSIALV